MSDRHPGHILSTLTRSLGLWPRQLAEQTGIPYSELMALYRAERAPSCSERIALGRALGCTPFALKRLYAEHLAEFIEDCAQPRLVEALPWELRTLEPVRYDAVVLVHPDWDIRGPQRDDLRKLVAALDRAARAGVPRFVIRAGRIPGPSVEQLLENFDVRELPFEAGCKRRPRDRRRMNQREVSALAELLGRRAERMCVAFGGMYADACVWSHVTGWCRRVRARWGDPFATEPAVERPRRAFAVGDLVDELLILNGRETALGNLGLLDPACPAAPGDRVAAG